MFLKIAGLSAELYTYIVNQKSVLKVKFLDGMQFAYLKFSN